MAKLSQIFAQIFVASCLLALVTPFPADSTDALNEGLEAWLESLYKIYKPVTPDQTQDQQLIENNFTPQQPEDPQDDSQEQQKTMSITELYEQLFQSTTTTEQPDLQDQSEEQTTQSITSSNEKQQVTQSTKQQPDSHDQSQEQQHTQKITKEKWNLIRQLLAKLKIDKLNKELLKKLKECKLKKCIDEDSDEDNDDSKEETTTTTTTTTQETSTTTETTTTTTEEPTTTTTTTTSAPVISTDDSSEEITTQEPTTTTTSAPVISTDDSSEEITTPEPICFSYKPDADISYFLQFDGISWLKKSCPYGYGFDYSACDCCIKLSTPEPITTEIPEETTITTETTPSTTTTTTTEKTTTTTPSLELCNECVILHGVGYVPFPGYCDTYIQCFFDGNVPTALNIRKCPIGTFWNQEILTCDHADNVKCTPVNNCPNHKAVDGDWSAYFIFNGQDWIHTHCPTGFTFNTVTCGCTDKHDDSEESFENNCSDKKSISGDKTGYWQMTGNGWVRMPCPATVGYSELTCGCTDTLTTEVSVNPCPDKKYISDDKYGFFQFNGITWVRQPCPATLVYNPSSCICTYDVIGDDKDDSESKDGDICKPTLSLNFDNNDATDSSKNNFWVNNTGVIFNDGKAYFSGKSRLTIPGLSNMEFGSTVYIYIKYRHTSASTQQTLVANGDCQVRQSLAVCSGKESVDFYAETKEQLTLAKVTVPADIELWQNVVYAFDKNNLQGSVGANTVSQSIKGSLARRQRGLVIGAGGDCDSFHGIIDEIQVYMCKPNF